MRHRYLGWAVIITLACACASTVEQRETPTALEPDTELAVKGHGKAISALEKSEEAFAHRANHGAALDEVRRHFRDLAEALWAWERDPSGCRSPHIPAILAADASIAQALLPAWQKIKETIADIDRAPVGSDAGVPSTRTWAKEAYSGTRNVVAALVFRRITIGYELSKHECREAATHLLRSVADFGDPEFATQADTATSLLGRLSQR